MSADEAEARVAELLSADVHRAKDISRLTIERDEAQEKLAEREAELANVDALIATPDASPHGITRRAHIIRDAEERHSARQQNQSQHAARQQQKD